MNKINIALFSQNAVFTCRSFYFIFIFKKYFLFLSNSSFRFLDPLFKCPITDEIAFDIQFGHLYHNSKHTYLLIFFNPFLSFFVFVYFQWLFHTNKKYWFDFFSKSSNSRSHYKALLFQEVGHCQLFTLQLIFSKNCHVVFCTLPSHHAYGCYIVSLSWLHSINLFPQKPYFFPSFSLSRFFLWCKNQSSCLGCLCIP